MKLLSKVISGGQTGVDQAALAAAKIYGIPTGGWMPSGFLTESGPRPEFEELYGMRAHASPLYPPRTRANIDSSDGTLALAYDFDTRGELLTTKYCGDTGKHYFHIYLAFAMTEARAATVIEWIRNRKIRVLNVAGNAEAKNPGSYQQAYEHLCILFHWMGYQCS